MKIDKKIKDKIEYFATTIVSMLNKRGSAFINIQVEEEYSQYDVLFSYLPMNEGFHQRGIKHNDLLIGVIGFGCYGFSINITDTDPGYYKEKLGIRSNFLAFLFNEIRKKLKES